MLSIPIECIDCACLCDRSVPANCNYFELNEEPPKDHAAYFITNIWRIKRNFFEPYSQGQLIPHSIPVYADEWNGYKPKELDI